MNKENLNTIWYNCAGHLPNKKKPPKLIPLVAANIYHFLTAAIKFSCFSSNEIGLLCFLSLGLAVSLL